MHTVGSFVPPAYDTYTSYISKYSRSTLLESVFQENPDVMGRGMIGGESPQRVL